MTFCDLFSKNELSNNGSNFRLIRPCIGDDVTLFTYLLLGFATGLICFLGILGNALSALVLLKSQFKSSVNFLLLGLTVSDTIVILYSVASFVLPNSFAYFQFGKFYNYNIYPLISPYLFPIGFIGQTGSVYFTVAVTVERYVVVCWPLYAKSWCTNKRARSYTLIVFLFSTLINFPKWFEIEVGEIHLVRKNMTNSVVVKMCYVIESTPLRANELYKYLYVNWTYFIFMYAIPFILLVSLNSAIYNQIKRSAAVRRSTLAVTLKESRETSVAKMLLCVVVVFLACNFLAMLNNVLESFGNLGCSTLIHFSNFFVVFNSCSNFGIYYIFGQKFRSCFISTWNELVPRFFKITQPSREGRRNVSSMRTHLNNERTETVDLVTSSKIFSRNNQLRNTNQN